MSDPREIIAANLIREDIKIGLECNNGTFVKIIVVIIASTNFISILQLLLISQSIVRILQWKKYQLTYTYCHSQAPKAKLGKALLSVYVATTTGSLQPRALKPDQGLPHQLGTSLFKS